MDIEPRDGITILGFAASVGGMWMWIKSKFKGVDVGFQGVEADKVIAAKRFESIEKKFVTKDNEPALMTYLAHDHICSQAQKIMLSEFKHVADALNSNSEQLKEMGEKIGDMSVLVAVLEGKVERGERGSREIH